MNTLIVSIIIPAYNAERFLSATIESVLSQTLTCWELIIVNDGSIDGTQMIAERFVRHDQRIRYIAQNNSGVSNARRRGYAAITSQSEYVAFLDSDDVWTPRMLETLVNTLNKNPLDVGAYCLFQNIDDCGNPVDFWKNQDHCRQRYVLINGRKTLLPVDAKTSFEAVFSTITYPSTALIRRSYYEKVGGFDANMNYVEDTDLFLRLSTHGDFEFVNETLIGYRIGHQSASSDAKKMRQGARTLYRKHMYLPTNSLERRRYVAQAYRNHEFSDFTNSLYWSKVFFLRGRPGAIIQFGYALRCLFAYISSYFEEFTLRWLNDERSA